MRCVLDTDEASVLFFHFAFSAAFRCSFLLGFRYGCILLRSFVDAKLEIPDKKGDVEQEDTSMRRREAITAAAAA